MSSPPDEILEAYRAGRLLPGQASRLEALLAHSAAGRQRLAALAGVEGPRPSETLREKVLEDLVRVSTPAAAEDDAVLVGLP